MWKLQIQTERICLRNEVIRIWILQSVERVQHSPAELRLDFVL